MVKIDPFIVTIMVVTVLRDPLLGIIFTLFMLVAVAIISDYEIDLN